MKYHHLNNKCFLRNISAKIEIKIEDRLNVMNIKNETPDTDSLVESNASYPANMDEFFDRTTPQFFLLQVSQVVAYFRRCFILSSVAFI